MKGPLVSVMTPTAQPSSAAQEFHRFADQVARHLPGWDAYPDDTGWGTAAILTNPDHPGFVRLAPAERLSGFSRRGQVAARWIGDHGASHIVHATIATGEDKVAAQIRRRLLCGIDELAAHQAHRAGHVETRRGQLQAAVDALSAGFPVRRAARIDTKSMRADVETAVVSAGNDAYAKFHCAARSLPDDAPIPDQSDLSTIRVDLQLSGLTFEQAQQVRGLLAVFATRFDDPGASDETL